MNIILECAYCGDKAGITLDGGGGDISLEDNTLVHEGDLLTGICPECDSKGMPRKILGNTCMLIEGGKI